MELDVKTLIAKLNPVCRLALQEAAQLCVAQTNFYVEVEHFLSKIAQVERSDLSEIIKAYDIKISSVAAQLTGAIEYFKRGAGRTPTFAPLLPTLLQEAWLVSSLELKEENIRSGGILLAVLENPQLREAILNSAPALEDVPITQLKVDLKSLLNYTVEAVGNSARKNTGSSENNVSNKNSDTDESNIRLPFKKTGHAIDKYTINVSAEAEQGKLDDIIGRDFELSQAIDILMRRRQNNPLLIGDPGVGKTALVEALANAVANGDVPPALSNIVVRTLDLGLLQAGAGVRGEFEERLKSVIDDVKKSPDPIILFIDEAHTLIGAGGSAGQGDAANLLKPALARGELRTIGATTWSEYKKYIEKDPALARRFQLVHVKEPEPDVAVSMLRGVAPSLEKHHGVMILESGLREAVSLSSRYIVGRQLPDKAISVLDTACSRVAIAQNSQPIALQGLSHRLIILKSEFDRVVKEQQIGKAEEAQVNEIADEISKLENEQLELEARYNSEKEIVQEVLSLRAKFSELNNKQIPSDEDRQKLDTLQLQLDNIQDSQPMVPVQVDGAVIADVISGWTGIPVGKMVSDEIKNIINLSDRIGEYIIGQSDAIEEISKRIQTARANLNEPGKPTGVFLLVGPSGVGKTETALALAELLYGGEDKMITINMSEYQEAHTVAGLKGAPPGYVGYGSGGVLTEAVRRNPYSVILLDEFEKAHPDVGELFYQVFDKGILEDSEGQEVNFKNALIIMTSNLGSEVIIDACADNPDPPPSQELTDLIRPHLQSHFKAALLGRMSVIPYLPLNKSEYGKIVEMKLAKIRERIMDRYNASLSYSPDVVAQIVDACEEIESGARVVDRVLNQTLLPGLSGKVLDKMATGESIQNIKIGLSPTQQFEYYFDNG